MVSYAYQQAMNDTANRNSRVQQELAGRQGYNAWVQQQNDNRDQQARNRVENAREQVYGLTGGRLDELRDDPVDRMILEQLQGRATSDVPYDDATVNTMMAQGNEASAAAFQNQQRHLDRNAGQAGIAVTDPAYQAQMRENKERQTQRNIQTRRDVNAQARVANHGAQGQALGQLGNHNDGVQNRITNQTNNLVGLHAREIADVPDKAPMSYGQWSQQNQAQPNFRLPAGYKMSSRSSGSGNVNGFRR